MIAKPPRDINRVAICVATMGRPTWLIRLLESLEKLRFSQGPTPELIIVVCDNDPGRSAEKLVADFSRRCAFRVLYVHEPKRGIPFARNACVRTALAAEAEAVAFIDDDETPAPNWLDELLAAMRRYDAHVVTGPVIPDYEEGVPEWMIRAGFFERPKCESGALLPLAATNNVLAVRQVLDAVGAFDGRFALNGGDDSHFFWRARAAGAVIVWSSTAVVHETVPMSRARVNWLVQRAYRVQNSYVFCERELLPMKQWMPRRIIRTMGIGLRGVGRLAIGWVIGRAMLVRGMCDVARAVGSAAGAFGSLYSEYRTIHGQ